MSKMNNIRNEAAGTSHLTCHAQAMLYVCRSLKSAWTGCGVIAAVPLRGWIGNAGRICVPAHCSYRPRRYDTPWALPERDIRSEVPHHSCLFGFFGRESVALAVIDE